jgi:hypothetical protein
VAVRQLCILAHGTGISAKFDAAIAEMILGRDDKSLLETPVEKCDGGRGG